MTLLALGVWAEPAAAQPAQMVKDIRQVAGLSPSTFQRELGSAGNLYFFVGCDDRHGCELWASDGTTTGTRLVKDIEPGLPNGITRACCSNTATTVGSRIFFLPANTGDLWTSDGTEAGTHVIKGVGEDTGPFSGGPFTPWGSKLAFVAKGDIWTTDGTDAGTGRITQLASGQEPASLAAFGPWLLFTSTDPVHGRELWRTDASPGGTSLVADIRPGSGDSDPSAGRAVGNLMFFNADDGIVGRELWVTDGTEPGTRLVKDMNPGSEQSSPSPVGALGSVALIRAYDGVHGTELWRSDGTAGGTYLLADINPGAVHCGCQEFVPFGDSVFFRAESPGSGHKLWKTNGTVEGTLMVRDVHPGDPGSFLSDLTVAAGKLHFKARVGTRNELWGTDGTNGGTTMVRTWQGEGSAAGIDGLGVAGSILLFGAREGASGMELWRSDGTEAGTAALTERAVLSSDPTGMAQLNGRWYFSADDGVHGHELWTSDGTAAGTQLVRDINPGPSSSGPYGFFAADGLLLFRAYDDVHGAELWRTDGSEAGTLLVKDLGPQQGPCYAGFPELLCDSSYPRSFVKLGGQTVFLTTQPTGNKLVPDPLSVWRTDGTEVSLLGKIEHGGQGPGLVTFGNSAFLLTTPSYLIDPTLFVTDGTSLREVILPPAGERKSPLAVAWFKDALYVAGVDGPSTTDAGVLWHTDADAVTPTRVSALPSSVWSLVPSGDHLFFWSGTAATGIELWKSDGTGAGTQLVLDINPGATSSSPENGTDFGGVFLFTADDGSHGRELWRSDGTTGGTFVLDVNPGASSSSPANRTDFGGVFLFTADDGSHGRELWRSDGTPAGTFMVEDIHPGSSGSTPSTFAIVDLVNLGRTLLFVADDGSHGGELWRSDGTAAGTFMLADIRPGSSGSAPSNFTVVNGAVYFTADDGIHGTELWRTDGLTAELVQDIVPGPEPSFVRDLNPGPLGLLMSADDGVHGAEPWFIAQSELPLALAVADAQVKKPVSGQALLHFSVTLSKPSPSTVTVAYQTVDGTAIAGRDFVAASGTVTFVPGEVTRPIDVPVLGGSPEAARRSFVLRLGSPSGAGLSRAEGLGTIKADIVPVVRSFTIDPVLATGPGQATLTWFVDGSDSVTISGVPGVVGPAGTTTVAFSGTTRYTLTATSPAGTTTATATINVPPAGGVALAAPSITAPASSYVSNVAGVTFRWNAVSGAAGYDLRLFAGTTGATVFAGALLGANATSTLILLPEGAYRFAVRACTAQGFTDASCGPFALGSAFMVDLAKPTAAPVVVFPEQGASLTSSTQTLSWTGVTPNPALPGMTYEVLLRDLAAGTTALQINVPSPDLSTVFTMKSSSQYELKVRACQAGCGPWSIPVTFAVTLPPVPTSAPTGLSCSITGGNSLACNWNAVTDADAYQVQVVQAPPAGPGGGALTVAAKQVSTTTVTLPVPPGSATVFISACNGDGCGPNAAATITAAGANPSLPNIGTPMAGTVVNGPSVLFTWNRVPGDTGSNTFYRLFVQDLSRQSTALDVFTTNNFYSAFFKAEGARYDALVVSNPGLPAQATGPAQGFNVAGSSATAPTMVSPAHNSTVTSGNIQLGWSPVPGATLYEYFVAVLGQGNPSARGVTPGLLAQVPLSGGGGGTLYSGIVRACTAGATCASGSDAGWGPWSNAPGGPGVTNFTVVP